MPLKKKKNHATGSTIAGAGAVTAGTGLAAGGIPGVKADSKPVFEIKPGHGGPVKRRVTAVTQNAKAAKAGGGGVLGFRTDVHQGGTEHFKAQADKIKNRVVRPGQEASHAFSHGYTQGKIPEEEKIMRHMRGGRIAAGAALVGGGGATIYGVNRSKGKRSRVKKSDRRADQYHGTLLGTGAAGAAVSHGGSKLFRGQEKKWTGRANRSIDDAQKLVPALGGRKGQAMDLKQQRKFKAKHGYTDHPFDKIPWPKSSEPERGLSDILRDKKAFHGVSTEAAHKAGQLHGAAAQQRHFADVYRSTGKAVGRMRTPSLIVAGAGAGGLAATRAKDRKGSKVEKSAFGVEHTDYEEIEKLAMPKIAGVKGMLKPAVGGFKNAVNAGTSGLMGVKHAGGQGAGVAGAMHRGGMGMNKFARANPGKAMGIGAATTATAGAGAGAMGQHKYDQNKTFGKSAFGVDHELIEKDLIGHREGKIKQRTKGKTVHTDVDTNYEPGSITHALGNRPTKMHSSYESKSRKGSHADLAQIRAAHKITARSQAGSYLGGFGMKAYGPRNKVTEDWE